MALQTGLALENSRLTFEIAAEIADREKRKREMEIAREVQQRLFPQTLPVVAGLEVAGACRPALAVGGDYYDFVSLPGGSLGIAIGDISGKGIPASLLMATLRAYLRSQTLQAQQDLPTMIANLNSLVFESSDSNRYATFFYGRYDAVTRVFDYVNAGHNPPWFSGRTRVKSSVSKPADRWLACCRHGRTSRGVSRCIPATSSCRLRMASARR